MFKRCAQEIRPAMMMLLLLTILTGVVYPVLVTGLGQLMFSEKANGSLIRSGDVVIGSELISQEFTAPRYFWPRPSAASYNAASSSGSNLAPSNPGLLSGVKNRLTALHDSDPANKGLVPPDLVLSSGSGLDPHISVDGALWQADRVAKARDVSRMKIVGLIHECTTPRTFGILGEETVNVLRLNVMLDAQAPMRKNVR